MVKTRLFDHIDLRVRNRAKAQAFFARILPALGFTRDQSGEEWGAFEKEGERCEFFGFTEDAAHQPNQNRIAFWADSKEEADRIARVIIEAGGKNPEGPQLWPEYSPGYYAFFFEDPDGNKFEICFRGSGIVAGEVDSAKRAA
jgi:catechol 2,3-dioxygenase-like lactoylglutathione lyase family enzyme